MRHVMSPAMRPSTSPSTGSASTARGAAVGKAADTNPEHATTAAEKPAARRSAKAGRADRPGRGGAQDSSAPGSSGKVTRQRSAEQSDVQVSAVISTYLLTHLHHVLQRAEFTAAQEGRQPLAANYAQLRQVLCLEARSLESPSMAGDCDIEPPCAA